MVMCCCERFTDCYELFTEISIHGQSSEDKICLSFHGSLTVSASCDELFMDTSELLRMLAIDYELVIHKES